MTTLLSTPSTTAPTPEDDCTAIKFSVPGAPRGKARPQARAFRGKVQRFKDSKTAAYESLVRLVASEAMENRGRIDDPVFVEIDVFVEPVASTSRSRYSEMIAGRIKPTKAPDLDNIVKSILDGCNGVVFRDDVLVVKIAATKSYAVSSRVEVNISRVP
jgi:Holliday junction resolvase RusA-like endonuclease